MQKLLIKYLKGDCTDQEKIKILNWLESDPEHMKEYLTLRRLHDITVWNSNVSFNSVKKSIVTPSKFRKVTFEILKIAAIFLVVFIGTQYVSKKWGLKPASVAMQTLHVPAGQRAEITLADGTKVWLNAKTTFTFPTQFTNNVRNVSLDGEGFFDVVSDKAMPFIVTSGKYNVKVLGTKFNMMAYSSSKTFETSLLEGSVEISKIGNSTNVTLKPNEKVTLRGSKMIISQINDHSRFLWKEGIISFDNLSFAEIIQKLELYFDISINLENEDLLKNHYTGKFRMDDGIEHVLKVLQLKNKFRYEINTDANQILIE